MSVFEAIVLGFIQGLTEFLPISSTGHLILVRNVFAVVEENALAFDAILHLATAGATILYFHRDLWSLLQALLRKLGRLPVNERELTLLYAIAMATVPAVLLGLSLESLMATAFRSPLLVAGVLVLGSLLFIYAEWVYSRTVPTNEMTIKKGLFIGLFQSLALIPGMSRSGASIAGGMLLGLSREEAARFAFLIAIPVILGAGSKKLLELITADEVVAWGAVGAGALVAFITALFAIHFMLSFVRRYSLWPFIWYRLLLAGFVVFIVVFG
jgi:undecaprenyl-diphosphatase